MKAGSGSEAEEKILFEAGPHLADLKLKDLTSQYLNIISPSSSSKETSTLNQDSRKLHHEILSSLYKDDKAKFDRLVRQSLRPVDINFKSLSNWTLLHYAAMFSSLPILCSILNFQGVNVHALTDLGMTALHIAAKCGKADICFVLVESGINPDVQDKDGETALHYAVQICSTETVRSFVEKSNPEIKNNKGRTAKDLCTSQDIAALFPNLHFINARLNGHHDYFVNKILDIGHVGKEVNLDQALYNEKQDLQTNQQSSQKDLKNDKKSHKNSTHLSRKQKITQQYRLTLSQLAKKPVKLSDFDFYRQLGGGAFGKVYIVKRQGQEQQYAMKVIPKDKIMRNGLEKYVRTEKEVLNLINHPFIVKLHCSFQTDSHLFLAMDYCEGGDLSSRLKAMNTFKEHEVKAYASEILLAIEALHAHNIIYRDLKPQNIVLDRDGHAMLTDFGLSKKTDCIDDINSSFCGTPAYLPLEIINRKGHNRMVDWYEFGVVLYEMFVGGTPYMGTTRAELYEKARAGIVRFKKSTPADFKDLVLGLLTQNPQNRLGYKNDAQSIKEHPWFRSVNWDTVFRRQLKMPEITPPQPINLPIRTEYSDVNTERNKIPQWSVFMADPEEGIY